MKKGQVVRIAATTTVDFVFFKSQNCVNASIKRALKFTT